MTVKEMMQIEKVHRPGLDTLKTEIYDATALEVEAGTTGYMGGDGGHGGRTYFRIEDIAGTDSLDVHKIDGIHPGFFVSFSGDSELRTMIKALKFILTILEGMTEADDAES